MLVNNTPRNRKDALDQARTFAWDYAKAAEEESPVLMGGEPNPLSDRHIRMAHMWAAVATALQQR